MRYVVKTLTALIYLLACAALAFGVTEIGRAAVHATAYEPAVAREIFLPSDPYGFNGYDAYCYGRYGYEVDGTVYLGPGGCIDSGGSEIRVLYNRSDPGKSILDDVSKLIASGIRWIAFGGVLGLWASVWRSRSVSLHGRQTTGLQWGSGAWGLLALFGFSIAAARDIADTREGFCGLRRGMLAGSFANFVDDHERRFPRDWLNTFRENVDKDGVLTGSPECLAVTRLVDLVTACAGGFHITTEADVGSPVCDFSGKSHYKVDLEFVTDEKFQTVNVRFPERP